MHDNDDNDHRATTTLRLSDYSRPDPTWPRELRNWHTAARHAWDAYAELEELDARRDTSIPAAHTPHEPYAADINELRRMIADAWDTFQRIDAMATRLLGRWDADNCAWYDTETEP